MRKIAIKRTTSETDIALELNLDGCGEAMVDTGCGFMDHMLDLFVRHGGFDLKLTCKGDVQVDYHHTVEDVGIVLGRAFSEALADRMGICRYGSFLLPMDESLVITAIDISGRATLVYKLELPTEKIGDFDTELIEEFFLGFTREICASVHIHKIYGNNSHHIAEAAFKGFGRALSAAVAINAQKADVIPSTKGTIL